MNLECSNWNGRYVSEIAIYKNYFLEYSIFNTLIFVPGALVCKLHVECNHDDLSC